MEYVRCKGYRIGQEMLTRVGNVDVQRHTPLRTSVEARRSVLRDIINNPNEGYRKRVRVLKPPIQAPVRKVTG